MGKTNSRSDVGLANDLSDALVVLYLTEETGRPCETKGYDITPFEATDAAGNRTERRALRITIKKNTPINQQCHLLTFGSDEKRCNVILKATEASAVHCKVYALFNSGPNVWLIDDTSTSGTEYVDEESRRTRISKTAIRGRVAAYGLHRIQIGRNVFGFWLPPGKEEKYNHERWFQDIDHVLVTQEILQQHLRGVKPKYCSIDMVGQGGMGAVFRYMEATTGLMIAVKEEEVKREGDDERIQREIAYMQSLEHVSQTLYRRGPSTNAIQPNLVEYIAGNPTTNAGVKKWYTAMPLYQGCLCDILPLEISAIENVMVQLFNAVGYLHVQRVLHKDIKPENVLVKAKTRPDVVLADYGLCASFNNQAELMTCAGTHGFAAPEVSRMIVQTTAVDVFALGATFFYILEPERCRGQDATVATLENVMRRPPKVYGGLVQHMMARDAKERPSLKECYDIVKARLRGWKKRVPVALPAPSVPSAFAPRRSQRIQRAIVQEPPILDPARFAARRPRFMPIAENRQLQKRPELQQAPVRFDLKGFDPMKRIPKPNPGQQQAPKRSDFKVWHDFGRIPISEAPKAPKHEPQRPAPVQQVDFSVPAPPISPNPFAHLDRHSHIAAPAHPQAPPATPEPPPPPPRKPDNPIKRRIRRGPERREMVQRWHALRVQKNNLCRAAAAALAAPRAPLPLARGLADLARAGLGLTGPSLGLIFTNLAVALPALRHIAAADAPSRGWRLDSNARLICGLRSRGCWPLTPDEYESERALSRLNWPNTTEGREARGEVERCRRYWEGEKERERERRAGRVGWEKEKRSLGW